MFNLGASNNIIDQVGKETKITQHMPLDPG